MSGSFGFHQGLRYSQSRHTAGQINKEKYGIRGGSLRWFTSYLTKRQQYVSIDGVEST